MHREIAQYFHIFEVAWPIHFLGGDGDDTIFMDGLKDHVSSQLGCIHDAQDVNLNHHSVNEHDVQNVDIAQAPFIFVKESVQNMYIN